MWKNTRYRGYEASSEGQIRGPGGEMIVGSENDAGYRQVTVNRRSHSVHVLVCEAFHGPRPAGAQCKHRNEDRLDNSAENVYWSDPVQKDRGGAVSLYLSAGEFTALEAKREELGVSRASALKAAVVTYWELGGC